MDHPWFDPQLAVEALEKRASPEVSKRGRAWVVRGRVREVSEESGDDEVTVRGRVTDSRAEHTPVLTLSAARVDGVCSCGERPWPCGHLLALARSWARSAAGQGAASSRDARVPWRQLLTDLVPGGRKVLTAGPDGTLVHWLELRPATPSVWTVAVSWRLHRATGRGLGRGQAVRSEALLGEGGAEIPAAERRVVRAVLACAAGEPSVGGTVTVASDAVDLALRALAGAGQVRWQGLRSAALFELLPVRVALTGQEHRGGLAMKLRWEGPDGSRWQPEDLRVVGSRFPWVECSGVLSPVAGVGDGAALALLVRRGVEVPAADLPALLGSVVPALENGGVPVSVSGLEGREFLVSPRPRPRLYLWEEGGNLVATLAFAYGDYEIPGESPELVVGVGAGQSIFVRRDMEEEFHTVSRLREFGFRMTDAGRFELNGDAAYDFLLHHLDELSGEWEVFGRGELRRYRVSGAPVSLRVRLAAGVDWLDLSVETEVEDADDDLPVAEVLRALRRGARYVRLGSGAHALLPEEWSRRLGPSLETLGVGSRSVRVPHYLAPLVEEVAEQVPLRTAEGQEVWGRLQQVLSGDVQVPARAVPAGLQAQLRPYQLAGFRWLRFMGELGFGCILADDMGLGKTVQALALLLAERDEGRRQPCLVVAPTSVVPNWEAETRRFAPELRVLRYHGAERRERLDDVDGDDLVITSYAVLRRDIELLAAVSWNYAVLDESQVIKNAATQTARAARRLVARRRLTLTGTPLENHLGELWSQFQFLMPGLLGSERRFTKEFVRPIAEGDERVRDTLRRRIRPFTLRRLKSEVAQDLPEKVESVLLCEMGEEQVRLYRTLLAASRQRVLEEVEHKGLVKARFSVLEALLRLRQVCCLPEILPGGAGDGVPSAKFELFCQFVREVVSEGHRVLIFSQFVKVLTVLRRWFEEEGIVHLYLDGRTRNREERVRRFQEDESVSAFLVSLKAGGAGLNLTAADYVILFDPWWNPAVETQATDRAHRIGQQRKVFAYKMITRGTVEEKILELQARKRDLTDQMIESGAAWGETLTEGDLQELFELPGEGET